MPQSLAKVNVHIVFSTKNGANMIKEQFRNELHAYFVGVLSKLGSYTEVEEVSDLFYISINVADNEILQTTSSLQKVKVIQFQRLMIQKWIKMAIFGWQPMKAW